jgi:hypothetical protein
MESKVHKSSQLRVKRKRGEVFLKRKKGVWKQTKRKKRKSDE